jgi:XTP/dITP diphosphohydrolase
MRDANDPTPLICQGSWEGRILEQASGENGFGYDPLFYIEEKNCSSAELDASEKNRISHRGTALSKLIEAFGSLPGN